MGMAGRSALRDAPSFDARKDWPRSKTTKHQGEGVCGRGLIKLAASPRARGFVEVVLHVNGIVAGTVRGRIVPGFRPPNHAAWLLELLRRTRCSLFLIPRRPTLFSGPRQQYGRG